MERLKKERLEFWEVNKMKKKERKENDLREERRRFMRSEEKEGI